MRKTTDRIGGLTPLERAKAEYVKRLKGHKETRDAYYREIVKLRRDLRTMFELKLRPGDNCPQLLAEVKRISKRHPHLQPPRKDKAA